MKRFILPALAAIISMSDNAKAFEEYQAADGWVGEAYISPSQKQAAVACQTVDQLHHMESAMGEQDSATMSALLDAGVCRPLFEGSHGVIIGAYRPEMIMHLRLGYAHKLDCCKGEELFIRVEDIVNLANHSDKLIETYHAVAGR